jgi:3-ketosteroid 9alpha-monooxygenase subunit A
MIARHEFEVDTARAVEAWEAEVAANLAARAAAVTDAPAGAGPA